jgi:amino acid adenylation domain-containing protein
MTIAEFIDYLRHSDVQIWAEGNRLHCSAPSGGLPADLQEELGRRKDEILKYLLDASLKNLPASPSRQRRDGSLPLSYAQQRLWFLNRLEPDSTAYLIATRLPLSGPIDPAVMNRCLTEIVRRHEILRTTFPEVSGLPVQKISAPPDHIPIPVTDISHLSEHDGLTEIERIGKAEAGQPLDIENGPLFRVLLLRLGKGKHILFFTVHHIICDGWSIGVLAKELGGMYRSFSEGHECYLPDLAIQFADYAIWQRESRDTPELDRKLEDYARRLSGSPHFLELPTDRPRPPVQTHNGRTHSFMIPRDLVRGLEDVCRKESATPFMGLLGVFAVLLSRYTGQEDFLIGCPVAGRGRTEFEPMIGMFASTVVLRADLSNHPSFSQLLLRIREAVLNSFTDQDVPFERLVERMNPNRNPSYSPLFQVCIAPEALPGASAFEFTSVSSHFDLTIILAGRENEKWATFEYNTDLFDSETIARMSGHYLTLLEEVVHDPAQPVSEVQILPEEERHQLLVEWNRTEIDYPKAKCIHELFEECVAGSPHKTAIRMLPGADRPGAKAKDYSYDEINRMANQLASRLRHMGVGRESHVSLHLERSVEMIVSILAILKAGGAYVPIDIAYPRERVAHMVEDSQSGLVITKTRWMENLDRSRKGIVCIDEIANDLKKEHPTNLENVAAGENDAYIMYTSGSTGEPKGVCVTHRNVVHLVRNTNYADLSGSQTFLHHSSTSFDASTFEIWASLLNGAMLVIAPPGLLSLQEMGSILQNNNITTLLLTTGLFHLMVENQRDSLSCILQLLVGGDVLSAPHARQIIPDLGNRVLVNAYGPTENTTLTCCYSMNAKTTIGASVPIGRPISNTRVYILDQHLQPVPIGVVGELFAGGDGVAREYWNRPKLNSEMFMPDKFSNAPGDRLYRTGDLVRYRANGLMEFVGRRDGQIKIRGFRIELGEIEATLRQCPDLRDAAVAVRNNSKGDKTLIAFVIPRETQGSSPSMLKRFLGNKLPAHMVPGLFVQTDVFPLTANGKIDREALLRLPGMETAAMNSPIALPRDSHETQMLALWQRVLDRDDIGVEDNFFDIGGHSLLAVDLCAEIERVFGCRIPLSILLQSPTVRDIAATLSNEGQAPSSRSLIVLQKGGSLPPIFLVPGVGGNALGFVHLATTLSKEQPVYALQSVGLDGKSRPLTTIEQIAGVFRKEIEELYPEGPLIFGGACMGGLVAYEMAQQFLLKGRKTELLFLMDTFPALARGWHRRMAGQISTAIQRVCKSLSKNLRNLLDLEPGSRKRYLLQKVQSRRSEEGTLASTLERVSNANLQAVLKYIPKPYLGQVILIMARERELECDIDPLSIWEKLAVKGSRVYWIDASDSGKMLLSPHVEKVGAIVGSFLPSVHCPHV